MVGSPDSILKSGSAIRMAILKAVPDSVWQSCSGRSQRCWDQPWPRKRGSHSASGHQFPYRASIDTIVVSPHLMAGSGFLVRKRRRDHSGPAPAQCEARPPGALPCCRWASCRLRHCLPAERGTLQEPGRTRQCHRGSNRHKVKTLASRCPWRARWPRRSAAWLARHRPILAPSPTFRVRDPCSVRRSAAPVPA